MDVSLKLTAVCIVDRTGKIQREGVVHSDPEAIAAFIKSNAPHVARIGLETGATSTWLWTELDRLGLPVICIDARHAKAALKMQINKNDRNDAVGIARIMCVWAGDRVAGSLVYVCLDLSPLDRAEVLALARSLVWPQLAIMLWC